MYSSVSPIAVIHETTTKESIFLNILGPKVFSYSRIACKHRCGSFWLRLLFIGIHLDPIHVCRWILFVSLRKPTDPIHDPVVNI